MHHLPIDCLSLSLSSRGGLLHDFLHMIVLGCGLFSHFTLLERNKMAKELCLLQQKLVATTIRWLPSCINIILERKKEGSKTR